MNKFVVFAVLAACAFAESMFPAFENYHHVARDDDVVLTPHELPCAYEIQFHQDASVVLENGTKIHMGHAEGVYLKHDSYFKARAIGHNLFHNNTVREVLLRSDIRDGENVIAFSSNYTYFNHTHGEGKCESQTMTLDEMKAEVNEILYLFVSETRYQKKEPGTFDHRDCTVYINENETAKVYVAIFVDSDNYIIGANYTREFDFDPTSDSTSGSESSGSLDSVMVEMIAHVHYRHFAPHMAFVLNSNHSIGCDDRAYVPPADALCYVDFKPASLPCACGIDMKINVTFEGTEVARGEETMYVHGMYYGKLHTVAVENGVELTQEIVVRSDLVKDGNVTVFMAEKNVTSGKADCENTTLSQEDAVKRMNDYLHLFITEFRYDTKETREFQGKEYTAYVDYIEARSEGQFVVYVDENNRIVAIEEEMPHRFHERILKTVTVTYKDVALTDFVIEKDIFDKVCDDAAYDAPTEDKCGPAPSSSATPTPSSSAAPVPHSSSMASTTVAAVAMTLLSIVVALL